MYDILSQSYLRTSGTKEEEIKHLIESPWSERSMLNRLRRIELSDLCRKLGIQVSGVKNELIDRLIEGAIIRFSESTSKAENEDQESQVESRITKVVEKPLDVSKITDVQKAELPKGLQGIKSDFPNLDPDEQIILSLIKETKSLTEYDIERTSRRHGLGWFLTKAHMSELTSKLRASDNNPLSVRSVRSVNIYEWTGEKYKKQDLFEKKAARDVIDALRQGVVPNKNIHLRKIGTATILVAKVMQYVKQ